MYVIIRDLDWRCVSDNGHFIERFYPVERLQQVGMGNAWGEMKREGNLGTGQWLEWAAAAFVWTAPSKTVWARFKRTVCILFFATELRCFGDVRWVQTSVALLQAETKERILTLGITLTTNKLTARSFLSYCKDTSCNVNMDADHTSVPINQTFINCSAVPVGH